MIIKTLIYSLPLFICFSFFACTSSSPVSSNKKQNDLVLTLYRNSTVKPYIFNYFTQLTTNSVVTSAILETCDSLEISPSLAFSLAWNESRFDPEAISYNPSSIDRGLFQLNSKTFSHLSRKSMYDPKTNTKHALAFFKYAVNKYKTVNHALAYYNSGIPDANSKALPKTTKIYIKKIQSDQTSLDSGLLPWLFFSSPATLTCR